MEIRVGQVKRQGKMAKNSGLKMMGCEYVYSAKKISILLSVL